jgi:ABC-type lipoprotein release transport system permease subunit
LITRGYVDTFKVIVQIAFRNLFASRLKTAIVGGIIFFGALLVVVGSSIVDSIDKSMSRSIIGSVAGNIQVYHAKSKDDLEVMGGFSLEGSDLEPLEDFAKVQRTVRQVPNVKAVVPMGISGAIVTSGNTIDVALEKLRAAVRGRKPGEKDTATGELTPYQAEKAHVRQMVTVLRGDYDNIRKIQDEKSASAEDAEAVNRAASEEFWGKFDDDPLGSLEFLENKIAPLATDADMLWLRYVGTDPAQFAGSFDRMRIVDGTAIPRGKRGFLFSKFVYEDQLKLKTARRLDKIKDGLENRGKKIATDLELQRFVKENSSQVREILLQLDKPKTDLFRQRLQKELGSQEQDVAKLLAGFLKTDDQNFQGRYKFFYDQLAPSLDLYRVRVGDTLVIKAFTKSGYVQSVKLRVYGSFNFAGLEKSQTAGELNIMDMVSFRELYGFMTAEKAAEIAALKAKSGARDIDRANAEAELFGSKTTEEAEEAPPPGARTVEATAAAPPVKVAEAAREAAQRREMKVDAPYDAQDLERGVVLNAAVILHDPKKLDESIADIEAAGKRAGLPLKAISWQKASGLLGQMVVTMRAVLYVAVLIIFVVALVIINNALVMATLERVQEIGTLRAVGAQRRFVLAMLVLEALVVGILFGTLGAAAGALVVLLIAKVGIPAPDDIFFFFFSGPRLHPTLGTVNLVIALVIVFFVSAISSFYPAWLAMRFTPRQAMQTEE